MITSDMNKQSGIFSRAARAVLVAGMAVGLSACATGFKADVSRFATQLPAPTGQTFAVVAEDPALAGGLEFALYADHVAAEMTELGYVETENPEGANLLVRFDYDVDNGRERVRSNGFAGDPFFGAYGATKGARIALVRSWAAETARTGPEVRILAPADMPTSTRARFHPGEDRHALTPPEAEAERLLPQIL